MELDIASVSIADAITASVTLLRERAADRGVALASDVAPALPPIQADGRKVKQVIVSLLSNAVKFTPAGGRVIVTADARGGEIVVAVTDTGVGVEPADQERIFEEFEQAGPGRSEDRERASASPSDSWSSTAAASGSRAGRALGSTFAFALPIGPAPVRPGPA